MAGVGSVTVSLMAPFSVTLASADVASASSRASAGRADAVTSGVTVIVSAEYRRLSWSGGPSAMTRP